MSGEMTHGAPRRLDGSLVAQRIEPGAMGTGHGADEVSHGCDQCRPDLGGRIGIGAVVAARVKTQRSDLVQSRNAAFRKYVSAIVPGIGVDIAKRRRADSGEPTGADGVTFFADETTMDSGKLRKRRASVRTS